jgi:plastocyanin domain-containing protein
MNKNIIISASIIGIALILSVIIVSGSGSSDEQVNIVNTSIVNGTQFIDITAKGGYQPRYTTAKANLPTIIRMNTSGTYDCSSAISIPKINYRKNLLPSGITEIEVPPQEAGSTLTGNCSMGMYSFSINFE